MRKSNNNIEFNNSYFLKRNLNDKKRLKSFLIEKKLIKKFVNLNSKVCDVGCSTGEFLKFLNWTGKKFGMEINKKAISSAKKKKIDFNDNILTKKNYFDVVIFRGTIQHLEQPFFYLKKSYEALKKGGHLFILATPNTSSIYYRLFQTLPALDENRNFYLPSFKNLKKINEIYGFKFVKENYPYLKSGYENIFSDYLFFILKIFGFFKKKKISFPGNMMNLVFRK